MQSVAKTTDSYSVTLEFDETPASVAAAVNNVRGWWSEDIEGTTDKSGEEFTYRNKDIHRCTIRVGEMSIPTLIIWHVVDNYFNFTDDATEWKGTEIRFEITRSGSKTQLCFTHLGLVADYECFEVCSNAWDFYLRTSLRGLIRTGKGLPNPIE